MPKQSATAWLGVLNHESQKRILPVSVNPFVGRCEYFTAVDFNGKGWILATLPFLEEAPLHDRFESADCFVGNVLSGQGLQRPVCLQFMATQWALLRCPSEESSRELSDKQFQWLGISVALTNYKGVIGDTQLADGISSHRGTRPDQHATTKFNGVLGPCTFRAPVKLAHVTDGASKTLMIGEDVPIDNLHSAAFYSNGDWSSCHGPVNYFPDPTNPALRGAEWYNDMTFRSLHPGGAYFCLVDGSVTFIAETIEHDVYRAMATKDGGEIRSRAEVEVPVGPPARE